MFKWTGGAASSQNNPLTKFINTGSLKELIDAFSKLKRSKAVLRA